jgi:ABC transport system ATP-binding/permease protein
MNILLAENLSKTFGEKTLFEDLTFGLDQGQKLALIAANGSGKSTLMNIIMGKEFADSGKITTRKGIRISYLPQNPDFDPNVFMRDALLDSGDPVMELIRNYEDCLETSRLQNNAENRHQLDHYIEQMDKCGAWDYERKITEVLDRLGLAGVNLKTGQLSGGQRKRLALARVLIGETDLLLLDEPTNHLDIQMIEWLEDYLAPQKLSLLMVTHDRYFLDTVCDEILELDRNTLFKYKGNYTYFLEKKSERLQIEAVETERARNLYKRELEWMRRMPQARTTKSKARIDGFYELEEKARRKSGDNSITFETAVQRIGGKILEMNNVSKSFDTLKVLDDFTYTFKKGERIGIAGPNGSGKSTFLNLICSHLKQDSGRISPGQTIQFGYYSQEGMIVKGDPRVIDIVKDIAEIVVMGKGTISVSQFLSYFNFSHTTQYSYYSTLSGGEKRRLFLLTVLMRNPNFLILDEPTNDLDIATLQVLEEFLTSFTGCLMIVSHDRFFLDKLVDHIFVFEENGKVKDFYGNYTEYRIWKKKQDALLQKQKTITEKPVVKPNQEKELSNKPTYKEKKEYESLTREISILEKEKEELLSQMNAGSSDADQLLKWAARYEEIVSRIDICSDRWLVLAEKIENQL